MNCKCKLSCSSLRLEYRQEQFRQFQEMGEYSKQQAYLFRLIHPQVIKRRRHGKYEHPGESRRQHSFHYYLLLRGGSEVRVCLKTFCNTFGISARRVQLIGEKIVRGEMECKDKRGGAHTTFRKQEWREKVMEHIKSFPTLDSHYSRSRNPQKKFLSPDLNVSRMYRSFLEKYCHGDMKPPVSRQWYNEFFLTQFNLSFARPRVDTCSTCDRLTMQMKTGDKEAAVTREFHHRQAEAASNAMCADTEHAKSSEHTIVISFDMQQQMYLPSLTHSEMYFSRQIACCNLGIHDEATGMGTMCLWLETVVGRGSLEVAHCLHKYLSTLTTHKKKLILWSDNCAGQNKNQVLIAIYLTLLANGKFKEIIHKFPVRGHTFLSCDRDFGHIEKRKHKCKAETLMDLVRIITQATVKQPFSVMIQESFTNFKELAHQTLDTKKLKISTVSKIMLKAETFGQLAVAKSHGDLQMWGKPISILKPGVTMGTFKNISLVESKTKHGLP